METLQPLLALGDLYYPVFEASVEALSVILTVEGMFTLVPAVAIGLIFGALPGFGGFLALALVFPFVFQLPTELGFLALAGTLGGTAFGASLPAIMLNTPGLPSNIATCWDGNPMAQNGEMKRAIGTSATSSAMGAVVGLILLILLIPFLREIILVFGSPEMFTIALVGLLFIAVVGRSRAVKGLIALLFGLTISFIGGQTSTGIARFTFDSPYLYSGIELVSVAVGMYAITEAMRLTLHVETIGGDPDEQSHHADEGDSIVTGALEPLKHKLLFLRSSALGWIIGLVPGVGGTFANVLAYTQGQELSKDPDRWGTGIPEGVLAPEAANDAKDGGATIPTITFGIPGSGSQVFFLAGMTANGLFPGTDMLTDNLEVTMTIIFGLLFANVLTSLFGLIAGGKLSDLITNVSPKPVAGVIVLLALFGVFVIRENMTDVYLTLLFGLIGYVMWRYEYPRILIIIPFVLGPVMDRFFGLAMQTHGPTFMLRPIPIALLVVLALVIIESKRTGSTADTIRGIVR